MPVTPSDGVAWVTGASQGIGEAVCLHLAKDGWTVIASARSADKLAALAERAEGPVRAHPSRRRWMSPTALRWRAPSARSVPSMAPSRSPFSNAGTYLVDNAESLSDETLRPTIDLNLVSVAKCLKAVLAPMREAGRGHVQVVASVSGYRGLPNAASYGASKAALINMAESLKLDFDRFGPDAATGQSGFRQDTADRQKRISHAVSDHG